MNRIEKKIATRRRILDAAVRLFSEQGYENTTVEQITKMAGVAKGTFFNYFQSKEELMCDLQIFWAVDEIKSMQEKPGPYIPRFKAMCVELVNRMPLNRQFARALLQSNLCSSLLLSIHTEALREVYEAAVPVIRKGQEQGEFVTKYPPLIIVQMAIQTFFGALYFWSMEQGDAKLSDHVALTMELFFDGVSA